MCSSRVAVLDSAAQDGQLTVRAAVEYWSAPFHVLTRPKGGGTILPSRVTNANRASAESGP
jgi:hypothetical protein